MAGQDSRPVQISIVQGEAYVWSADDIATLRRTHGIVGMLSGSLPLIPQQNAFLGVPLELFEEEVVYLLRRKAAIIVDDVAAHKHLEETMGVDALKEWHKSRHEKIQEKKLATAGALARRKERWLQENQGQEAKSKRKGREERKQQQKQHDFFGEDPQKEKEEKEKDTSDVGSMSHQVVIAATSLELPWHSVVVGKNAFQTLSAAKRAGLWVYPSNVEQRAKCAAFESLREKGYYMSKGLRFGGDLVVYPGDPLRYHSHFTATVQTKPSTPLSAQELVSAGRLGTAVKKAHLLCAAQEEPGSDQDYEHKIQDGSFDDINSRHWSQVDFYSLTWAGFGT